jgi:hypothetical protein
MCAIIRELKKVNETSVSRVLTAESDKSERGVNQAMVEELRSKLHKDYNNVVLCEEALPDPPDRGRHCVQNLN